LGTTGTVEPAIQRAEIVSELSETKQLLKELNTVLLSGKAKVLVAK